MVMFFSNVVVPRMRNYHKDLEEEGAGGTPSGSVVVLPPGSLEHSY